MIKLYTLALIFILFSVKVNAQKRISGKILDENANHIPYASVMVLRAADSVRINAFVTDTAGNFTLSDVKSGKYFIKVSYIGYRDYYSPIIDLNALNKHQYLGLISLDADTRLLKTVNINSQRPLIEETIDRTIMNIENSILATGNTALELLTKVPGLIVSENGDVSLKGKSGTTIMINGKPTYLSGDQLANVLKGTNSSSISRIEIMSNPTAQFEVSGNGGIVNIIMKKNLLNGFNGNISGSIGSGKGLRHNEGISMNYNTSTISLYGSYNTNNQNIETTNASQRMFYKGNPDKSSLTHYIDQESHEKAKLRSQNFRIGTAIKLNEKNTLGFLINGAIGKYPTTQAAISKLTDVNGAIRWTAHTQTGGEEHWKDLLYNANYVHKFHKEGHELKVDIDYVYHFSRMEQFLDTRYLNSTAENSKIISGRKGDIPSSDDIYAAKIDYLLPLNKTSKLEVGWKGSYVRTENNLQYDTLKNGQFVQDASTSNHFVYQENIQAAYVNLSTTWREYQIQTGLRAEYTNTTANQLTTSKVFKRDYLGLFPSLFLSRGFAEIHQLKAGYTRRIKRPSYWDLNPFRVYSDPFAFYEGNPYLKPAIANALEIGYSLKSRYFATLSYSHTSDVISDQVGQIDDGSTTFERPENLGSFDNIGVSITTSTQFSKWWVGSQFVNLYHNSYRIKANDVSKTNSGNTLNINLQNTFNLGKGWKVELSAFYISKQITGITEIKPYSTISSGIQKEVLKGKANLKFMLNDIFEGYRIHKIMTYNDIVFNSRRNSDTRYVVLSFSYRFGIKSTPTNERNTISKDLKDRM